MTTPVRAVTYRGHRGDGVAVTGRTDVDDLAAWVELRYEQGWTDLAVFAVGQADQVAGINRTPENPRTWWADATHAEEAP